MAGQAEHRVFPDRGVDLAAVRGAPEGCLGVVVVGAAGPLGRVGARRVQRVLDVVARPVAVARHYGVDVDVERGRLGQGRHGFGSSLGTARVTWPGDWRPPPPSGVVTSE